MSTSPTVPIFDPSGTLRDVPYEQMKAAVAAGGKPGVFMQAPDGSKRAVPADKLPDALTAGGKLLPIQQQSSTASKFWDWVGDNFSQRVGERIQQNLDVPSMVHGVNQAIQQRNAERAAGVPAHGWHDIKEMARQYVSPNGASAVTGDVIAGAVTGEALHAPEGTAEGPAPKIIESKIVAPKAGAPKPSVFTRQNIADAAGIVSPRIGSAIENPVKIIPGYERFQRGKSLYNRLNPQAAEPMPTGPPEMWGTTIPQEATPAESAPAAVEQPKASPRPMPKKLAKQSAALGPPQSAALAQAQQAATERFPLPNEGAEPSATAPPKPAPKPATPSAAAKVPDEYRQLMQAQDKEPYQGAAFTGTRMVNLKDLAGLSEHASDQAVLDHLRNDLAQESDAARMGLLRDLADANSMDVPKWLRRSESQFSRYGSQKTAATEPAGKAPQGTVSLQDLLEESLRQVKAKKRLQMKP